MKLTKLLFLGFLLLSISNCKTMNPDPAATRSDSSTQEFYHIKTYTLNSDEQIQTTDKYLKEAYLPGLKKQGIQHIGVFKSRSNEQDSLKKIYVLIPGSSVAQLLAVEEALASDKTYLAAGSDYLKASYDKAPYLRLESTLLKAFSDMPMMQPTPLDGPRADRVYELRSYESATEAIHLNKVDMFNAGGEVKLFKKLGFNAVFYGSVLSGSKMPNLMYMTTFADQASRDAHWKSFVDAPEWNTMKALPKYQNNVSHIDIMFLYPTEYSDY